MIRELDDPEYRAVWLAASVVDDPYDAERDRRAEALEDEPSCDVNDENHLAAIVSESRRRRTLAGGKP